MSIAAVIVRADEKRYNCFWVMDDDEIPHAETLQHLLLAPADLL